MLWLINGVDGDWTNDYCRPAAGSARPPREHARTRANEVDGARRVNGPLRNRACAMYAWQSDPIALYRFVHCACIFHPHHRTSAALKFGSRLKKKTDEIQVRRFQWSLRQNPSNET